jgi:hypothetical protein
MTVKAVFSMIFSISPGVLFTAEASQISGKADTTGASQISGETDTTGASQISDKTGLVFDEMPSSEASDGIGLVTSFLTSYIFEPTRVTLKQEGSYKFEKPDGIINNRSSVRLEYSKFFLNNFFLQFDSRLTTYWKNDHRAKAEAEKVFFELRTREAFLQTSFLKTSIKAGIQILAWGESEVGAITDEISPRDYREMFNISLEALRLGQPMLTVDQYSSFGDWGLFFIPYPDFNEYPKKGTAYYYDPFNGKIEDRVKTPYENIFEYGMRWKKTFGKSDISVMAARLINNDYAYGLEDNLGLITKNQLRYYLAGMTFNYALRNFLVKGEVAMKSPKAYNNAAFHIVKKDAVDASLGFDYSPGGTFSLSLESVTNFVADWNDEIQGVPEVTHTLVLFLNNRFIHDDLSVFLVTLYSEPYTSFLNILTTSFNWNDHVTLYFDAYYPFIKDRKSYYWIYRDQKQVVFKFQYQF